MPYSGVGIVLTTYSAAIAAAAIHIQWRWVSCCLRGAIAKSFRWVKLLMHRVERKLAFVARVPVAVFAAEHGTLRHRSAIDVRRDGDAVFTRIANRVEFMRRNQAAGRARTHVHRAARFELVASVALFG